MTQNTQIGLHRLMKIVEWQQPFFYQLCFFSQLFKNSLFSFQSGENDVRKTVIPKKINALGKFPKNDFARVEVELKLIRQKFTYRFYQF